MSELKSQEQLKRELSAPLPPEAVKPHPTKTYLSSIKAIYVTERLNDVFGIGKWTQKVRHEATGEKGMVVIHVTLEVPEYGIYYECFGGNDNGGEGSKNFDLGDAYKGATTDATTKICSYLGIGIDVFKGKVTAPQTHAAKKPEAPKQDAKKPEPNLKIEYSVDIAKEIDDCLTADEVADLWKKYIPLQKNEDFKRDIANKGEFLKLRA